MDQLDSWRTLLGNRIKDSHERGRIASELGINPATLTRWASGATEPRPQNLRQLLRILPSSELPQWQELIAKEFPDLAELEAESKSADETAGIPTEFYSRVINTFANVPTPRRFWAISNLVLQQALAQLDPNNVGMSITIAQCMPPSGAEGKIRSLREVAGQGTPPWTKNLEPQAMFLGIESLAGYTVSIGYLFVIHSRSDPSERLPVHWLKWEESAIASPILQGERIAGCLLASSMQPNYFSPLRQALFQRYTELLLLAFTPESFYDIRDLKLQPMPPLDIQHARLSLARQRVSMLLLEAARKQQSVTIAEAELAVWQQIEDELLTHAYT